MKRMKLMIFLIALLLATITVPAPVSAVGNVAVTSSPAGAAIWLDGTSTGQVTPYTLTNVTAGSHTIILKLTGYADSPSQTVSVTDNATATAQATTLISAPTLSGISPTNGINNGPVSVTITGTGFLSPITVTLTNGSTSIAGANNIITGGTSIASSFNINGAAPGTWNVVVLNSDGGTATLQNGFTVVSSSSVATVTGITPTSAAANTTATVTITGTGFSTSNAKIRLIRTGYNDIVGTVGTYATTQLTGTIDLTSQSPGDYTACVLYDGTNRVCGPTFTINAATDVNGSIAFTSNPTGAGAYLNNVFQARTPYTLTNVTPGTYTVTYKLTGYQDLSQQVTVTAGNTADAYGYLPTVTLAPTTAPTSIYTVPTTVRTVATTKKSTIKVPTPWPTSTTAKSPLDLFVILGAAGLAIAVMRKH